MRVLHIYKSSLPESTGGVEQVIHQIASHSKKFGVESNVFSLSKQKNIKDINFNGYKIFRAKENFYIASTGFSFLAIFKYRKLVKSYDVLHYHFPWPFMDLLHFFLGIHKPTLITYHSDIVKQKFFLKIYQPLQNFFLKQADIIVATSPNYISSSKVLSLYRHKLRTIPLGLSFHDLPVPKNDLIYKWRQRLPAPFFLFVGVLRYYKGLDYLIDAASKTKANIVIVGSGPMESNLKMRTDKLGLKNIIFVGNVNEVDKIAILKLCYAFIFPSHLRSEAFGLALLEAAMYKKAMISCEIGSGTSFINLSNITGLVVPPKSPMALAKAMNYLLRYPQMNLKMGNEAFKRYKKLFTADNMVKKYSLLYKSLI
jgi:rhamnosyl/mannosyltransferase